MRKQLLHPTRSYQGFTLIELMIVLAIVAILASIALPSYRSSIAKGNRAAARAQLMQAAQYMQRFYSANDRYDADRTGNTTIWAIMPPSLLRAPAEGSQLYEISNIGVNASSANQSTFQLIMRPIAGASMANDSCGAYTLTQSGAKGNIFGGAALTTAQIATCWR